MESGARAEAMGGGRGLAAPADRVSDCMRLRVHVTRGALATITPDVGVVPPLAEQPPSTRARRVGRCWVGHHRARRGVVHAVLDEDAPVLRAVLPPSARELRRGEQALELAPISLELVAISLELAPMLITLAPISVELRAELQPRQARGLRRAEAAEQRRLDEPRQPVRDAQRLAALLHGRLRP